MNSIVQLMIISTHEEGNSQSFVEFNFDLICNTDQNCIPYSSNLSKMLFIKHFTEYFYRRFQPKEVKMVRMQLHLIATDLK